MPTFRCRCGVSLPIALAVGLWLAFLDANGDTFTNKKTGAVVKGKMLGIGQTEGKDRYLVKAEDGSAMTLPVDEWDLVKEAMPGKAAVHGPNVVLLPTERTVAFVQIGIPLENATALREIMIAILDAPKQKPDIVVLGLDTPGGLCDEAKKICFLIEGLKGIRTVAHVYGGPHGGAFSAGAMVALACDEIFMAEGTAIGAATPAIFRDGPPQFTEKMTSAFSAIARGLAEKHGRSPAIAAAMVDPQAGVREVMLDGKTLYVSADEANEFGRKGAQLGRWIAPKGKLLTLTANEAKSVGVAAGVVGSRHDLLVALGAKGARVVDLSTTQGINDILREGERAADKLMAEFQAQEGRLNRIAAEYNARRGASNAVVMPAARAYVAQLDRCIALCEKALRLARAYPDGSFDEQKVQNRLDRLKAERQGFTGWFTKP